MSKPYYDQSRTTARYLEEFSERFRDALALGEVTPWAEMLGATENSNAPRITYPLPVSAAGYHKFKDDMRYRTLYERATSVEGELWQDGWKALAKHVEAPDFAGHSGESSRMAKEALRHPNKLVAAMLALSSRNGPLLKLYDDPDTKEAGTRRLFANDHPVNILDSSKGTFTNYTTTTVAKIRSGEFFEDVDAIFAGIDGANGESLGLKLSKVLYPTARRNLFRKALDTQIITAFNTTSATEGVVFDNIWASIVTGIEAAELTSDDYIYAFAETEAVPWVVKKGEVIEIVRDKDDSLYKDELKVGFASVLDVGVAGCLPQGIVRIQITG